MTTDATMPPMQQQEVPQHMVPGALVQPAPVAMDLRQMPDGNVVLFINSVNGTFWFPLDPKTMKPFFEQGVKLCSAASSGLFVP